MKKFFTGLLVSALAAAAVLGAGVRVATAEAPISDVKAALLTDSGGTIIAQKNATERLPIASMVKIMTLNLVFDEVEGGRLALDEKVCASEYASSMGGSQAFLDAGASYEVGELIKSVIVASANDSCVALAERVSGSVPAFVEKMNAAAKAWGMENTNFVNCTGLPSPNGYSCAADVAVMLGRLIRHDGFFKYSSVWTYGFAHPSGRVTELTNTNKLVRFYEGCDGGKTGYTSEAGSCLAATAKRGETRLACVVIGAPDSKTRNARVSELFNYGFANYESKTIVKEGETIDEEFTVSGGKCETVKGVAAKTVASFGKRGEVGRTEIKVEGYPLSAPVKRGEPIGKLTVVRDGEEVDFCEILAASDVEARGYGDVIGEFIKRM